MLSASKTIGCELTKMETSKSENAAITEFKVSENEFVTYSKKRIDKMAVSLQEEGQKDPIFVNNELTTIWDGHTRFKAAEKLGWQTIKVIKMTDKEWEACIQKTKL